MSKTFWLAALAFAVTVTTAFAQVPGIIQYQGRVTSNGTNFTGTGQLKFAIIEPVATGDSLWSNDGTSVHGSEPTKFTPVAVQDGLFIVGLGDISLGNMLTIPASIFAYENLQLRIWFSDGVGAFAALSPDQKITSVGFAMKAAIAATVSDGAITSDKIADGAVLGPKIGANAITSVEIADALTLQRLDLGSSLWDGSLNLFAQGTGETRGLLLGDSAGSQLNLHFGNSNTGVVLSAKSTGGQLRLWDTLHHDNVSLGAYLGGGELLLRNTAGFDGLKLRSSLNGGDLEARNSAGQLSLLLTGDSNNGGRLQARNTDGTTTVEIVGAETTTTGGRLTLREADGTSSVIVDAENGLNGGARLALTTGGGTTTAELLAAETASTGAALRLGRANGTTTVVIDAENGLNGGARVALTTGSGATTVEIEGAETTTTGGLVTLRQADGTMTVKLDAESGGVGTGSRLDLYSGDGTSIIGLFPAGTEATLGGGGIARLGSIAGNNLVFDGDEILARSNGVAAPLFLNWGGGTVVASKVAINTSTPVAGYALSVNGKVICEELVVQDSGDWPDYVFADDYKLLPLEEVEASIQKHKHLPGIASAKKIGADGIPLGQIQKQMMEKIEELTLHLIQQNKRLAAQEAELGKLRSRLDVVK